MDCATHLLVRRSVPVTTGLDPSSYSYVLMERVTQVPHLVYVRLQVAVKLVNKVELKHWDAALLQREVQVMHHLAGHPNIVELKVCIDGCISFCATYGAQSSTVRMVGAHCLLLLFSCSKG